ncbi:MAG: 50S ribosomal protein L18 [Hyphomicrobiales bacterium]|jgi:large subunit ribosomal protein L18|nr:50S ribosomal protein L18 [Hyphomicrobiales bacterium]|tara:strand:+ start:1168 stop:1518 length:351 start_codon:yes stop_codon:yes gene_type:complete
MAKLSRDIRRQNRVRKDLKEKAADKCRLTVFRSSKHIYAQIIDDTSGKTIASASSLNKDFKEKGSDINGASKVGAMIGEKAINAGIKEIFFDRGKYRYHGRVKALAEGAREAGLIF